MAPLDKDRDEWAADLARECPHAGSSDVPTPTGSRVCCPFWSIREYDAGSYIYSPRRYLPAGSGPGKAAETPLATGSRRHGSSLGPNLPHDPSRRHKIYAIEEKEHTQYVKRPAAPPRRTRSAAPAGPRASSAAPALAGDRHVCPVADANAYDDGGAAPACLKRSPARRRRTGPACHYWKAAPDR